MKSDNWLENFDEVCKSRLVKKTFNDHLADRWVVIDSVYDLHSINPNRWTTATKFELYRARKILSDLSRSMGDEFKEREMYL